MILNTSALRKFTSNASFVPVNKVLPICGYLKIGNSSITKNNIHVFYEEFCEQAEGEDILVDEYQLRLFLNNTKADTITIKRNAGAKECKISDGPTTVTCDSPDAKEFPLTPFVEPEDYTDIPSDVMEAIRVASAFVINEELPTIRSYIMVSNTGVRASDGHVGVGIHIDSDIPKIILNKEVARPLQNIQEIKYAASDSMHLFITDDTKFGFNKGEFNFMDMSRYFDLEKHKDPLVAEFRVEKDEWIAFNNMASAAAPDPTNMASFKFQDNRLCLAFSNSAFKIDIRKGVDGAGPNHPEFFYNAALMNRLLKAIPDETVWCYKANGMYFITGESGYISLIMKMM